MEVAERVGRRNAYEVTISVENESVLGYESGSEPILLPDFSTNPGPNRFFYLNQILKSL